MARENIDDKECLSCVYMTVIFWSSLKFCPHNSSVNLMIFALLLFLFLLLSPPSRRFFHRARILMNGIQRLQTLLLIGASVRGNSLLFCLKNKILMMRMRMKRKKRIFCRLLVLRQCYRTSIRACNVHSNNRQVCRHHSATCARLCLKKRENANERSCAQRREQDRPPLRQFGCFLFSLSFLLLALFRPHSENECGRCAKAVQHRVSFFFFSPSLRENVNTKRGRTEK